MNGTLNITLVQARRALQTPATIKTFLDQLEHLSPKSITNLAPLMFDVVRLPNQSVASRTLKRMVAARPEWLNHRDDHGNTALMVAAWLNDLDSVDILLAAGAQVTQRNKEGHDVLEIAAGLEANHRWQRVLAEALLENASFTQVQKDRALYDAASHNNLGMIRVLIDHGAGLGAPGEDRSTLMAACLDMHSEGPTKEVVAALLGLEGAHRFIDKGWGNRDYGAPLHAAAMTGKTDVIALLLAAGASVNPPPHIAAERPITPLMRAANSLKPAAVKMLIDAGANATLSDADACNALHYAAAWNPGIDPEPDLPPRMVETITMLIEAGADPTARNRPGLTPCDVANNAKRAVVAELIDAMAQAHQMNADTSLPAQPGPAVGPRL